MSHSTDKRSCIVTRLLIIKFFVLYPLLATIKKSFYNFKKAKKCIESCDFKILKKKEQELGFKEAPIGQATKKKLPFFNLGSKNQWEKVLPEKILKKMNILFKEDLKTLAYE